MTGRWIVLLCLAGLLTSLPPRMDAAAVTIVNLDPPGAGFNDPTPATPVGGNPGRTIGEQRLIAFRFAARIWGSVLSSRVPVTVGAAWIDLPCTDESAVVGRAGPTFVFSNFPNAAFADTWYPFALANKLSGTDLDPANPQILAVFNPKIGQPGCIQGINLYYGLDNRAGIDADLVTTVLHELGHGLGFLNFTDNETGQFLAGQPSLWDHFLLDTTTNKLWVDMTGAERAGSALNSRKVVWNGNIATFRAPLVLQPGTPQLRAFAPEDIAGTYDVGVADFGPALTGRGVTGELMPVVDTAPNLGLACDPLSVPNARAVAGKVALIDRGSCTFVIKVKNAQNAGAIGVVIADNAADTPPPDLAGDDPTITIPSVRVSLADGAKLKQALQFRSRKHSGVIVKLNTNLAVLHGADPHGRLLMYTPNPLEPGSSVSHWDRSATPNLIMEPDINDGLPHSVVAPHDLTFPLLRDIGW